MAEHPEHVSPQFHGVYESDSTKQKPLEGTEKHPQGRLFAPTGQYAGDPMRLSPENWLDKTAHSDIIAYHGSEESSLPRSDEYEHRQYEDFGDEDFGDDYDEEDENWERPDYSVDDKDRPMGEYGSVVGMHLGGIQAARQRQGRPYVHPARIPESSLEEPPRTPWGYTRPGHMNVGGHTHVSDKIIYNSQTGEESPDERWSDPAANYSSRATDLVEEGRTLAYRNDVEAAGSTSYRTLPETTRTWSEDVMSAKSPRTEMPPFGKTASKYGHPQDEEAFRNEPHPALVHMAEQGFDPVLLPHKFDAQTTQMSEDRGHQLSLFPKEGFQAGDIIPDATDKQAEDVREYAAKNKFSRSRREEFESGQHFEMRKPTSAPEW